MAKHAASSECSQGKTQVRSEVIAVTHIRPATALCLLLLAMGAAHAAPLAAPLGGGLHGIALRSAPDATSAYAVVVAATSLDPNGIAMPELPADFVQRVGNVEQGTYVREEWDKGAFLRDNFSVRWTGTLKVDKDAEYTVYLTTDDGTRMTIDGKSLIDVWVPRPRTTSEEKTNLTAGDHQVVVEFYEGGGAAVAQLEWSAEGIDRQIIPADHVSFDGKPGWRAQYFRNTNLEGEPAVTLTEETIDHDWGEGGIQVGAEEPGEVVLEWTRIADNAIVGRVHSGPESKVVLLNMPVGQGEEARPSFKLVVIGSGVGEYGFRQEGMNARSTMPATEDCYVFLAGFGRGAREAEGSLSREPQAEPTARPAGCGWLGQRLRWNGLRGLEAPLGRQHGELGRKGWRPADDRGQHRHRHRVDLPGL
jgi:hypothetical protein